MAVGVEVGDDVDGMIEGDAVGDGEGASVGILVGIDVGLGVGLGDGPEVIGIAVGLVVGLGDVGAAVGSSDGKDVGVGVVGMADGFSDGLLLGLELDGRVDGAAVGNATRAYTFTAVSSHRSVVFNHGEVFGGSGGWSGSCTVTVSLVVPAHIGGAIKQFSPLIWNAPPPRKSVTSSHSLVFTGPIWVPWRVVTLGYLCA